MTCPFFLDIGRGPIKQPNYSILGENGFTPPPPLIHLGEKGFFSNSRWPPCPLPLSIWIEPNISFCVYIFVVGLFKTCFCDIARIWIYSAKQLKNTLKKCIIAYVPNKKWIICCVFGVPQLECISGKEYTVISSAYKALHLGAGSILKSWYWKCEI